MKESTYAPRTHVCNYKKNLARETHPTKSFRRVPKEPL